MIGKNRTNIAIKLRRAVCRSIGRSRQEDAARGRA
jgi:hypothetical protein